MTYESHDNGKTYDKLIKQKTKTKAINMHLCHFSKLKQKSLKYFTQLIC